ncbi:MAG: gluconate 2-dehydrogenase subunit 3 family protein [Acidobacteria bacterium]|nr:gluconate 2-dehydrogenase subunit 3 family protein [Acidobacteriota bacterium]
MTRRSLLLSPLSAATIHDIAAAQQNRTPLRYLTPAAASELEALTTQIIPSDTTPGAKEAGCIHFIDRALETFDRDKRQLYTEGLAAAQAKRAELFPQSTSLAALAPAQTIALLKAVESTDFFQLLRAHTIMGFLASPDWGGNQLLTGWAHVGLEHRMSFQPPFGFYDKEAR